MRKTETDKPVTPFNKEDVYKEQIEPLINELMKKCTIYNIPMFVTCCVSNNDKGSEYKNQAVTPDTHGLNLADDNIQKHIGLLLGFDVIYHLEDDFDYEDDATKVSS